MSLQSTQQHEAEVPPLQAADPPQVEPPPARRRLRIYSHSKLLYWWPVWVSGYFMALLTYWHGQAQQIGQGQEWFHPSSNLGVVFFLVLILVILTTNFSLRGLASATAILGVVLATTLLAYLRLWDEVLGWFGGLRIYLTLGAYFWFSTLLFLVWVASVFGVDRTSYWEVKPGQLTYETLLGAGSKSFNTQGMGLEKQRGDLFRNWLLGFGSGDLQIRTSGATRELIEVPNVLFIGSKIVAMQRLIAEVPDGPKGT